MHQEYNEFISSYLNNEFAQNQNFDEVMNLLNCEKRYHQENEFEKAAEITKHKQI
jgi:hypothetical protein